MPFPKREHRVIFPVIYLSNEQFLKARNDIGFINIVRIYDVVFRNLVITILLSNKKEL